MEKYKSSKDRVLEILSSKTSIENIKNIPNNENEFTYENGIKSWVSAIFVDIRKSTQYFKSDSMSNDCKARVLRAFTSEIINILSSEKSYREIGIRGDCVYGIFSAPLQKDGKNIISLAAKINSFNKMFQTILKNNNFCTFDIGIGIGDSEDVIIKVGKYGTGISDKIWLGNAVVDASNLSKYGNNDDYKDRYNCKYPTILISSCCMHNIKDFNANDNEKYSELFREYKIDNMTCYGCDLVNSSWDEWINNGMR